MPHGQGIADALAGKLARHGQPPDPKTTFAVLLADGTSTNQDAILSSINRSLDPIPLFGGSAGDDMRLQRTHVYHGGRFWPDAALLTLVRTRHAFRAFRCQHYEGSDIKMVVTEADPGRQVVTEINAEPAAREYARIIGVDLQDLISLAFAENPLMVRVGGDYYVRSIQKADPDGSLTFFCAIDVGVVLTLARRRDIVEELRGLFRGLRQEIGPPQLVIGFDCVLRSLELGERQLKRVVGAILAEEVEGEQVRGLVDNVEDALEAFGDLLNALLDISKLDAGVWVAEPAGVPIGPLLARLVREYRPQAAAGLSVRVVPASAVAHTDRGLLERVVRNFVSNAIRYTGSGRILIGCRRCAGSVRIEVCASPAAATARPAAARGRACR